MFSTYDHEHELAYSSYVQRTGPVFLMQYALYDTPSLPLLTIHRTTKFTRRSSNHYNIRDDILARQLLE